MAALRNLATLLLCACAGGASAQVLTLTNTSRQDNEIPLGYPVPVPVNSLTPVAGFRSYAALEDRLAALALGADIAAVPIGTSLRERAITAYRISDDDALTPEGFAEPAALINGGIHAREWAAPEVVTGLVERFAAERNDGGFYRYLLDSLNLIVVPVLNVDGFLQTQRYPTQTLQSEYAPDLQGLSSEPPEYRNYPRDGRLRRKNMRDVDEILCAASQSGCVADGMFGVDLNRNNDSRYFASGNQNSADPASLLYRGSARGSEPEIQALYAAAALAPRERLRLFSDTHSFGRVLYGVDTGNVRRDALTRTLAERMSAATTGDSNRYRYAPSPVGYGIGSTDEYFGEGDQIPAYTLEIEPVQSSAEYGGFGYHHDGFILPASEIERVRRELADAYSLGLYRMAGPPVLLAAQIRRADSGALVYAAQWQRSSATARTLQVDVREPLQAEVDYRLWLAFSKPMRARNASGNVVAFRGQTAPLAPQITIEGTAAGGSSFSRALTTTDQGWLGSAGGAPDGALRYKDDAYAIDFRLPASVPLEGATLVNLKVSAQDLSGQALDANPATVLDWSAGWQRYEDDRGDANSDTGGSDRQQRIVDAGGGAGGGGGGGGAVDLSALLLGLLAALRRRRAAAVSSAGLKKRMGG
ncbi:MAG TPA: M14 family metallopeptidase [Fontimonas sp.]